MKMVGQNIGIPDVVFRPKTHMTAFVGMALGNRDFPSDVLASASSTGIFLLAGSVIVKK